MGNSRNDFIGFNNEEIPDERPKGIGKLLEQFKARRSFVIAGVIVLGSVLFLVYFRPHLVPFLPDNQKGREYVFSKKEKQLYKIELYSGGIFYAGNTVITDDKITFINDRGLIVTINRHDVKKMNQL